jgi:hypothetical protein
LARCWWLFPDFFSCCFCGEHGAWLDAGGCFLTYSLAVSVENVSA